MQVNSSQIRQKLPYVTIFVTIATLFLFASLAIIATHSPSYLVEQVSPTDAGISAKSHDVNAHNHAVLIDSPQEVKMKYESASELLRTRANDVKSQDMPYGYLPYPVEPKPVNKK